MEARVNLSRRGFLRARGAARPVLRPPWAIDADAFLAACTRCAACMDACPTRIVVRGDGGFPELDFTRGECTFCRACAASCQPQALSYRADLSARLRPVMQETCLAQRNVVCHSCGDVCEARALRFRPRLGSAPLPELDAAACSGCGACVGACPTQAVTMCGIEEAMQ